MALDYQPGADQQALAPRLIAQLAEGPWWDWRPENLRKPGFAPATVIDIGAGEGTLPLLEAFPEAHHVLIEPLTEYEPALERVVAEHGGEYLLTAVGAEEGVAMIEADHANPDRSSMLPRVPAERHDQLERREVPVTTLDVLLASRSWRRPFGLKIDTEGFEHEVVRGAAALLRDTQFVIAEVSVRRRFERSYSFAEFIALMDSRGFALKDILMAQRAAGDHDLRYVDALFGRSE